jgi:hypothetical protein
LAAPALEAPAGGEETSRVMNPEVVILVLKVAVMGVTVLLAASLLALALGRYRLHGRINLVVFVLTLAALLFLEGLAHLASPGLFQQFFDRTDAWKALYVHLAFAVPTAVVLTCMLVTGLSHRRRLHIGLGICFLALWAGTLITGVFFLPHQLP